MVLWALARRLLVCLLRQTLPSPGDGGTRTAARLQLVLLSVVVTRWSNNLFIIFITFKHLCTAIDDKIGGIAKKKKRAAGQ
jgi:predicted membrane metal-binding protein